MHTQARRLGLVAVIIGVALWVGSGPASGQTADPTIGTWTLNVAKSTFSPGPAAKSTTVKFEVAGQGAKVTTDIVAADGGTSHTEYTANYDGKDYPITGSAAADTVSLKRIDASTTERTDKKSGTVVQTLTRKISDDGKVMTVTIKGTNAQGQSVNNLLVFERR